MATSSNQMSAAIRSMFESLKQTLSDLTNRTTTHFDRIDNPHLVTKDQVGLGNLPNAITDSRVTNSLGSLLTAKGMYDHTLGADHDTRYYTKALTDQALALKVDISSIVNGLSSTATDRPLSAAQGKVLNDAVQAINQLLQSDTSTLDDLQEVVNFIQVNRDTLDNLSIASISGLGAALDTKVDKIVGKGLSENDFTTALLNKLNGIEAGADVNVATNLSATPDAATYTIVNDNGTGFSLQPATTAAVGLMSVADKLKLNGVEAGAQVNPATTASRTDASSVTVLQAAAMNNHQNSGDHDERYYTKAQNDTSLSGKVDKVTGKALSTEDYTTTEKNKLGGIEIGAQVNVGTNLTIAGSGDSRSVASSTGGNALLPLASSVTAGLLSRTDKNKLDTVQANAEPNVATNLDRSLAASSITITNSSGTNAVLPGATTGAAGVLSSADKAKLNGIEIGAQVNVGTNLSLGGSGDTRTLVSSTGGNVALPLSTSANAGLMGVNDRTKLDGISAGAEPNVGTNLSINRVSASFTLTSSTGANVTVGSATASLAGAMSAADKAKLDSVASGADANVPTNLSYSRTINDLTVGSSTGSNVVLPSATTANAGMMSGGDKTKLNGIQAGADVNPATTASRTDASTTTVLQAAAMNNHRTSGDHDAQYVTKQGNSTVNGEISAIDFIYTSDESLKDGIEFVGPVSEKLRRLVAKQYFFKADPEKKIRFGYLAHEAAEVFPELLRIREDGKKALAYVDLVPLLTQGFREMCEELDEVRVEMATMQDQLDELTKLVHARL